MRPEIYRLSVQTVPEEYPDASYLEQEGWEDRLAEYNNGGFYFVGVRAVAELRFKTDQGGWIHGPEVMSSGLWGIESDSDGDYFREIGDEQIGELSEMLQALGISKREIAQAIEATTLAR